MSRKNPSVWEIRDRLLPDVLIWDDEEKHRFWCLCGWGGGCPQYPGARERTEKLIAEHVCYRPIPGGRRRQR